MENNYEDRIFLKNAELKVEKDPNRRAQLQRDLEVLNIRKQIQSFKEKIQRILNG